MPPLLSLLVGVLVVIVITVATGYFVAQEFAFMSADRSRLAARARGGDERAAKTLEITRRTSFMLSGAQLGITVTGLLVGYVAEPMIGGGLSALLGGMGIPTAVSVGVGAVAAMVVSTFVQMVFGELFPKNYAISRPDQVAQRLTTSTKAYLTIFGPMIAVFDKAAEALLRLLHIEPVHDVEHAATARDIQHLVRASRTSGDLPPELSVMLDRILDFPSEDVEHAMIPRAQVASLQSHVTVAEVCALMSTGHTRYPVIDSDNDILGIVDLVDVLAWQGDRATPIRELVRPAVVVPEVMSLPDCLGKLDEARQQLACVVDEYGGFTGIITVEDLAEEIVGELTDEHDPDHPGYEPVPGDGVWVMEADVHTDEVERALGIDLPTTDAETIGGLAIEQCGALPEEGDVVQLSLCSSGGEDDAATLLIEVLDVERHVPARVRLTLTEPSASGSTAAVREDIR
ncbi:hemolysin family protein [Luteococcus sp.]|uniref:hemolysin family protein n=1 Tax=Luteococcus sp. TaxID=1969402 RepID=UPI00373508B1